MKTLDANYYICAMGFSPNNWNKPTPRKWRKLGETLMAMGTAGAGIAFANDYKILAVTVFALSVIGAGLTTFFSDDE